MDTDAFEHLVAMYQDGGEAAVESRVLSSQWGTPAQRTALPYTPDEADALLKLIERPTFVSSEFEAELPLLERLGYAQGKRLVLPRADLLRQVGRRLYETLFPRGPVRTALNVSLGQARRARKPLTFQLHLDQEAGHLARLPWELLADDHGYLVQSGRLALSRYIAFKAPSTPLAVKGPVRVLVVVSRPRGLPALDGEQELAALRGSLSSLTAQGSLEVQLLDGASWRSFVGALSGSPYHIVHFDGHGEFGRRCPRCHRLAGPDDIVCRSAGPRPGALCGAPLDGVGPQGYLAFERPDGSADWRSAENLAAALFRSSEVRLAVLSACRSAAVGRGMVFGGTAPALIGMGVPAVAAMQYEVPLYATVAFAEAFYGALAGRRLLVEAVAEARARLDDETWYRPALYLRSHDDSGGALFA